MYSKTTSTSGNKPITTTTSTTTITATAGTINSSSLVRVNVDARTLEHGFGKIATGKGRLDNSFLFVLGHDDYTANQSIITSIIADIGHTEFSEYTELKIFDKLVASLMTRIHEPQWAAQLEALKESLELARKPGVEDQRCDVLLRLVETLTAMSNILEHKTPVGKLRKDVSKVVGGLYKDLWPEHDEPQLSARSTGAKKKAKGKKAGKESSNSSSNSSNGAATAKGGSIASKLKRLSMKFIAVKETNTPQQLLPQEDQSETITPQQLLAQEEGQVHGDDWAQSSQWWNAHGWKNEDAAMNSKHETSGDSSTTAATTTSPRNIASQPVALSVWKPKTLFSNFGPSGPAQDLVYFRLCAASCLEDTLFSHMSAILKISALISDREFTSYDDPAFFQGLVDSLLKLLAEGKFADDLDNFCVAIQNDGDYDEDHLTVMKFAFIVRDMCEALESSNPASVHALSGQIAEGLEHIDHWAASAGTAAVQSSGKPKKKAKKKEKQEKKAAKEKTANSSKKDKSVKKRSSQKLKAPDPRKSEKSDKRDSDSHDSWDA